MRFCEQVGCDKPVFGTDRKTRIGYCKQHQYLRTDIDKDSIIQRAIKKQRKNAIPKNQAKLRATANEDINREMVATYKSKSELLRQADVVFGNWIKNRDKISVVGKERIKCPCCGKYFDMEEVDSDGKKIVQLLHFVNRGVYSLRFDEDNAHAGDSYCNLAMHLNPKGKEYQNYRKFLVDKFGETAVVEMELKKRGINKITTEQLKTVIEHYSPTQ